MNPGYRIAGRWLAVGCVWLVAVSGSLADDVSSRQKQELRRIKSEIDKAGRLYQAENFGASGRAIVAAQNRMSRLMDSPSPELLALVLPEFQRLANAHRLLKEKGTELPDLITLPDPVSDTPVSFRTEVAPLLVAQCGRCHVNRNRGNFSAASYEALMNSAMVSPGMANESRIVEVIVEGDMPPGGSLKDEELALLKNWIAQGAKFDGEGSGQNLNQLTGNAAAGGRNPRGPQRIARPKGQETVSFGLQVAPILMESCGQCHVETNRPRGNFSMADFRRLMRGGDGGPPVIPGDSAASPLLQRMKGVSANVMPPSGKLDDRLIQVVETWIAEGAVFDGEEATTPLRDVAAVARANSQSHPELVASRKGLALTNWKRFMTDVEPTLAETPHARLVGDLSATRLESVGDVVEKLVPGVAKALDLDPGRPLVKGNATLFILERRYDLSELGTMLARRDLPREVSAYWEYSAVDAYAALLLNRSAAPESVELELARNLSALATAGLGSGVPRWFAEGMGYWCAADMFPRNDEAKSWEKMAGEIASKMNRPDDFMTGRMADHDAALVAYAVVTRLRSDSSRFRKLMNQLVDGRPFEEAFTEAFGGSVSELLGSSNAPRRGQRNR